ncbi:YcnI family protein [Haloechinothrix sp. LS1_15]|uniref:YcnI family protein n=1 Tax=Haloechinothrix sp. LS1_15 TaxID=2652248 RepID=UPI0029472E6A|nr:YcnI family protein [Haloechinothrix sp. LS1_15]MDV6013664.1 YcnI family protein [Haloechinothrix sp. LS1_15]
MGHTIRRTAVLATAALAMPLLATPALAHVTLNPDEADSPYFTTKLRVPHGCDGEATTAVRVQVPEGVDSAKPEAVPGWDIEIEREQLDEPTEGAGDESETTERVSEVSWTGGALADDQFLEFGLNLRIADDAPDVLWLPTIQECEQGEHRWIDVPDSVDEWGELDEPAPYVEVRMGDADEDDVEAEATAAEGEHAADTDDTTSAATPLAVTGLVAGLLGLTAGGAALLRTMRRTV